MEVFTISFIIIALLGGINAGYMTWKHYRKQPLVCPVNHDCTAVVESKWGNIFYLRNEILGIIFYLSMFMGVIFLTQFSTLRLYLIIGAGIGVLFSIFFTFLQIFIIKQRCIYCNVSALLSIFLFINSFFLNL